MAGRYRPRRRDELDDAQRAVHDRIVDGPRRSQASVVPVADADGRLLGPFGPMTLAPAVGDAVQQVGAALRFATTMTARTRESAILLVAARRRSAYEWVLHEGAALAAGVTSDAVASLREGAMPTPFGVGDDGGETDAALAVADRLLAASALTDDEYADAVGALGETILAELVWLVGYYSMLALALAVFEPPFGPGMADPWG
jgi:4-carboxymuconolactone decarboxylase